MSDKMFHISDVLSATTGRLLSTRRMDGLYEIMGHIVGEEGGISTIGLAAHKEPAREFLEREMPWLKEVKFPEMPDGLTKEEWQAFVDDFLKEASEKYGEFHTVGQMNQVPAPTQESEADRAYRRFLEDQDAHEAEADQRFREVQDAHNARVTSQERSQESRADRIYRRFREVQDAHNRRGGPGLG